ncbi:MAG TPA: tyrosine-type recombinase/integrase [Methanocorpusculum sp.]|nr:tyrosine-type recombinase/integrase [Methanocorpusculum sp.]
MRVSETTALRDEDIGYDNQAIRVRGKGGKIRTVFCDVDTLTMRRAHLNGRTEGRVWNITPRTIRRICERYVPTGITPHKIRHSYASELYKRSHNLRLVQEILGHSSIQTTQIYVHTDLDERREAYQEYFPRL